MSLSCPLCGSVNRARARFCWNCATSLDQVREPLVPYRPSSEDARWLESRLVAIDPLDRSAGEYVSPLSLVAGTAGMPAKEKIMDQAPSQAAPLFAGRYEIRSLGSDDTNTLPRRVEVRDLEPWRRCWACGSTSNEPAEAGEAQFCNNCGASLTDKRYLGQLAANDAPSGPALIADVQDADARETLPEIWEQVSDDGKTLTLLRDTGRAAITPPLDELTALRIGTGLARLMVTLHANGLLLGDLGPGDVEIGAGGAPHLRDVPNMRRVSASDDAARADAVAGDMRSLAALLEACTATPRTTQRLEQQVVEKIVNSLNDEPVLGKVLRDVRTGTINDPQTLADTLQSLYDDRTQPVPLRPRIGTASDTGRARPHNEDSLLALDLTMNNTSIGRTWGLYIVADGMGGHAAGEVASGLAIRGAAEVVLSEYIAPTLDLDSAYDEDAAKEIVRRAVLQANDYVIREAKARGNDMGTTLTMALVIGNRAVIGNVGDSRTYMYRDGELRRVSKDHSLVMRLVELGQISEDDIYTHPQRNAVLRSLGDKPQIEVDLFSERLNPGDALFLCSDGQWEMTHNPEMAALMAKYDDPQQACQALIDAANAAGGEDNITAVFVKFETME